MYLFTYWWWQLTLGKIQQLLIFIKGLNYHASDSGPNPTCDLILNSLWPSAVLGGWLGVGGAGVVMFQDLDIASCQICTNQP